MLPYTPPSGPGDFSSHNPFWTSKQSGYGQYWSDNGTDWLPTGNPPVCQEPLSMQPPVNFNLATSILYPGQYRGNNYKPHGGFRFDNASNNSISVKIPLDAALINGSQYIEGGERQHLFTFLTSCGIMYRFDHLLVLTPKFQAIADALPQPKENDSRTTNFDPVIPVKAGEEVATEIGFRTTKNNAVDFGVYDLRKRNAISQNANWTNEHKSDPGYRLASHAICWFDLFPEYAQFLRNLPAGDYVNGRKSDYCQ